jgi:hypothetical protein
LQVANLDGDFIQGRSQHGEGSDVGGVTIALDNLGSNWIWAES